MADAQPSSIWDFFGSPAGQGLLGAVAAGMAGARRGAPLNSIGTGLMGGLHAYGQAQDQRIQQAHANTAQQMADLQLKQAQQAQADQDQMRSVAKQYYTAPSMTMDQVNAAPGQAGPTMARASLIPQTLGKFDTNGFVNAMMGIDPLKGMQLRASMAKESQFDKFKPENYTPDSVAQAMQTGDYSKLVRQDKLHFADNGGGIVGLNPYTGAQVSSTDKTGDPFSDLIVRDQNGRLIPNQPLIGAKTQIAQAGAAKNMVNVNTAQNPFFSGLGQFGADQFKASTSNAQEAAKRLEQNKVVNDLLDSGKVYTGGGADWKLAFGKAAQSVGLSFDNDSVKNTEILAAQLANRTLNSIKSSGLGAGNGFTDADRKFLQEAVGGSITLNNATLKRLVQLDNNAAQQTIRKHNAIAGQVEKSAAMQGFPMSFQVQEPDISGGWSITPLGQ